MVRRKSIDFESTTRLPLRRYPANTSGECLSFYESATGRRQGERQQRATLRAVARRDLSTVRGDEIPGDGQSEPRAMGVRALGESIEDLGQILGAEAGSGVG